MNKDFDDDKFREECGVFGVYGHKDASALTALGLHALQHRGQEACGIVSHDGEGFYAHKAFGLVDENFNKERVIDSLKGHSAIGHNRYATTGGRVLQNVQPLYADLAFGGVALAHNGNLTNAMQLRTSLIQNGAIFQGTSDTEVVVHLMAQSKHANVTDRLVDSLKQINGAYSMVVQTQDCVIGVRDPHGVRPLVLGQLSGAYVMASETCALDIIGADFVRDVEAGEMIVLDKDGMHSSMPFSNQQKRMCIFEYIYFARPDSSIAGSSVYDVRRQIGVELAREAPVENAGLVVPVPDSGVPSAIGYAAQAKLPFELGIIRNHYVGRTFIEPTDQIRHLGVKLKHNANRKFIEGQSIVLVDDSIVRGTTSRKIVEMLKEAGVAQVHMRISSPPTKHSCFYGIDTPTSAELLANKLSVDDIADYIGVDSLAYISTDGLYRAMGMASGRDADNPGFCDACFTGDYAIELTDHESNEEATQMTQLRERV